MFKGVFKLQVKPIEITGVPCRQNSAVMQADGGIPKIAYCDRTAAGFADRMKLARPFRNDAVELENPA